MENWTARDDYIDSKLKWIDIYDFPNIDDFTRINNLTEKYVKFIEKNYNS